jgi:hypothetical protein
MPTTPGDTWSTTVAKLGASVITGKGDFCAAACAMPPDKQTTQTSADKVFIGLMVS